MINQAALTITASAPLRPALRHAPTKISWKVALAAVATVMGSRWAEASGITKQREGQTTSSMTSRESVS